LYKKRFSEPVALQQNYRESAKERKRENGNRRESRVGGGSPSLPRKFRVFVLSRFRVRNDAKDSFFEEFMRDSIACLKFRVEIV
jgi:hypothetical protein